jgi:hypothetical protein
MIDPEKFILAGRATFTIVSLKTSTRFTYRVKVCENDASLHFVQVLTGPDNTADYRYLGIIRRGVFFHTKKSSIAPTAPCAVAFAWFWRNTVSRADIGGLAEIHHEGRCGRCGRLLTVPESIQSGFGPECATKI